MTNYHHGQIAYEGAAKHANWKFPDGTAIPEWKDVTDEVRDFWSAAAQAVIEALLGK